MAISFLVMGIVAYIDSRKVNDQSETSVRNKDETIKYLILLH